ncbi:outer membrane protein assembly factor BamB family protein [Nonomuraea gerenzanensis]|uniref:Glucose dehydrogenase, PQQ-dependent n=1 Tax=Nonomuraea gerenzanensis TaxID=93944 RepID=A0A1M4EG06_9ACTN|nr:PQQ-binding-like beta-propeller repeat protein [Nonomuraea gerenzanensis]UBU09405.1 PQQ-binding-like beta-propeller repeat protein [Nonomuraea gerenzanensis]SBO97819.1 Glucose dehydrogenase, PQQ-dependent [Nonomuraea gerenzanensis]
MERRNFLLGAAATLTASATITEPAQAQPQPLERQPASLGVTGKDFPKVCGNLANTNYSPLHQINARTVRRLGGAWHVNLEGGSTSAAQQSTCVVQNGVLYVQTTQQNVFAVDGRTGAVKWKTNLGTKQTNMRGVALGEGLVFSTSGANIVYALRQDTGEIAWQRQLITDGEGGGDTGGCDPQNGQCGGLTGTLAGAVVYWDGLIYVGMQGSTGGARGRAYALKAGTGEVAWTFWSCPGEGQFGNDTWEGESWKTGGAVPWIHPAVDPDLGLVYWTFGGSYPRLDGATRGGDNLFANSIVAIDAKTGTRKWHFQSVHHDIWDLDNVMAPVLVDVKVKGRLRKAVVYGSKVGMFYILDRESGEPLHGMEERPVPQNAQQKTAATQPFPGGEPFITQAPEFGKATRPVPFYAWGGLYTPHWDRATIIFPGAGGGADWAHLSYNPHTGWIYVGYGLINSGFSNSRDGRVNTSRPLGEYFAGGIAAVDPRTNTPVWTLDREWSLAHGNGILTTAGRVMFQGGPDGVLHAMDDTDGRVLWSFQCGAGVHTSPISYEIDGEQYVAVLAGGNGLPYPDIPRGDHLWAFKLGGKVPPAATPTPPKKRNDIRAAAVTGLSTVTLGRVWDAAGQRPGATENTVAQNAMSPQHLRVPKGTTVTFVNPADNASAHAAVSFFEYEFDTGVLMPGQSFTHTFDTPGEYFYNDAIYPQNTGKIVVF